MPFSARAGADPAAARSRRRSCRRARSPTRRSPDGSSSTCSSAAGRALGHAGALDGARRVLHARARRRERASWSPARTARRAPSSTSAATAGRGCSTSPRAGCGGCSAPITRGPTASTACCATRRTPTRSRASTRACFGLTPSCASRSCTGSCSSTSPARRRRSPEHVGALAERLAGHRLGTLRRAGGVRYDVAANWKAIVAELLRVPALPGRAPGAQPAHALPLAASTTRAPAPGAAGR